MEEDVVRVEVTTSTGYSGCTHVDVIVYSREEWESMDWKEREDDIMSVGLNHIDVGACIIDGDGQPTDEEI